MTNLLFQPLLELNPWPRSSDRNDLLSCKNRLIMHAQFMSKSGSRSTRTRMVVRACLRCAVHYELIILDQGIDPKDPEGYKRTAESAISNAVLVGDVEMIGVATELWLKFVGPLELLDARVRMLLSRHTAEQRSRARSEQ